jgi:hypothetical protein
MKLSREKIQRMIDSGEMTSTRRGGGSGVGGGGGVSATWVDEHYISKDFFSSLFTIHSASGDITPNDTDTTPTSIEALFGFWSGQFISALGQGSGGGGGGGASSLASLTDVSLTNPTAGQVLKYDGTNWVNGVAAGGTVTSVGMSMPTGFSVSGTPVTGSGTLAVSFGGSVTANRVLASPNGSAGTPSWRSLVAADLPDLSGTYAPKSYFDSNGNALSALKLTTVSKTAWGQTFWTSGGVPATISGDMSSVGNITMGNTKRLYIKDSSDNDISILTVDSGNNIVFGETADVNGCPVYARGNSFYWQYGSTNTNRETLMRLLTSGQLYLYKGTAGLRIGDGLITWDSSNNALKIQKADGSAANIYALGGVTALGFSAGGTGLDSATITTLLTSRINFDDMSNYLRKNATSNDMQLVAANNLALSCGSGKNITLNANTLVDSSGYLHTGRVYLASNVYIYTDGSNAKLVIGSTTYTLTKS